MDEQPARFGPAGNSVSFYAQGYKSTAQAPAWLAKRGLSAFEYSLGRGVTLKEESATAIGVAMREHGITPSIHAPYFINFATDDPERQDKNTGWLRQSAEAARWMGATRVVFHPGSALKGQRERAMALSLGNMAQTLQILGDEGLLAGVTLCPETMGKRNQLGSLDEVLAFCQAFPQLLPCIDFGHLHTVGVGALNTLEDARAIVSAIETTLGLERCRNFHVHFSQIAFSAGGEVRHHNFGEGHGPEFDIVAKAVAERGFAPTFICESAGNQAEDVAEMKRIWEQVAK